MEIRTDKTFAVADWIALYHAADYHRWWTERNAHAALAYAFLVVTAWREGQMLGTLTVWSDGVNFAWIDDLVVHPDHRRQGIATRMMREAVGRIETQGIDHVQLFPIPGRESFFERLNFIIQQGATVMDLDRSRG